VPTNTAVELKFSKRIDQLTVTNSTFFINPRTGSTVFVPGTISVSADGLSVVFTPTGPLVPGTNYGINVAGIQDLEGQAIQSFGSTFTTGLAAANAAPVVVMVSPPNGTTGVPVNVRVDVVMSAPVGVTSVGSNAITVSAGSTPVAGTISVSSSGTTLTFTPGSLLTASTVYTVNVSSFTDQAGNTVAPFTSSFTTGTSGVADTSAPAVLTVSPANGAAGVAVSSSIVLTFNKNLDPSTVSNSTITVSDTAFIGILAGSYAVSGTTVTFTPLTALPGSTLVFVAVPVNGLQDLSGNKNVSVNFSSSFTTASVTDTTAPQVVATPNNGATGIGLNATVVLTFSKSVNPNTINSNTVGLLANGTKLNVSIAHSSDNRVVSLTPLAAHSASIGTESAAWEHGDRCARGRHRCAVCKRGDEHGHDTRSFARFTERSASGRYDTGN